MGRHPAVLPALALVFNALVWGTSWWPFRQLGAAGLHPLWTTALVMALAASVVLVTRRGAWRPVLATPALWVLALAAGLTNAAFNWGVVAGDVVRVVLLFYLMPLWAVLLARVLLHEPIGMAGVLRVGLSLVGAGTVLWPADGGWPWPQALPDWLGVLGGMAFALNNVMLRRESHRPEASRAVAMFIGGAVVPSLLGAVLAGTGTLPWPSALGAVPLAIAGAMTLMFLASNLALQYGAARLPSHVTSVVMLTEVLFAAASGLWLGAGQLTPSLWVGGACIVAAAALAALAPADKVTAA